MDAFPIKTAKSPVHRPVRAKTATSQELLILQRIPGAESGFQITLKDLIAKLGGSPESIQTLLSRLHDKGFVAIKHASDNGGHTWCERTALGEAVMIRRPPGRPPLLRTQIARQIG